jgi:tRNA(Arg) A34 adenosine deaminase TadA
VNHKSFLPRNQSNKNRQNQEFPSQTKQKKMSTSEHHEKFIRRAVELSKHAVCHGNHPFSALVSPEGEVLAEAENKVNTESDPTRHAELCLVSDISRSKFANDRDTLANSTLYTSCEPCMMCCGAIYWCGVRKIVYSCSHTTLAKWAGDGLLVSSRTLLGPSNVEITGPLLEELGEEPHTTYWNREAEK